VEEKGETYLRPDHLHRQYLQARVAGRSDRRLYRMPNSELIGTPGGKDIQRNVNLSPGAAPATSLFSSRSWCMGQRQSRTKGRVGFNDHVITTGLREVGELRAVLQDGNVFWGVSVGF